MEKLDINKLYIYIATIIYEDAITPFTQDYLSIKYRKKQDEINW